MLENVDIVELNNGEVRLENIFGEQRIVKARFKLYSNTQRKIVFEPIE